MHSGSADPCLLQVEAWLMPGAQQAVCHGPLYQPAPQYYMGLQQSCSQASLPTLGQAYMR